MGSSYRSRHSRTSFLAGNSSLGVELKPWRTSARSLTLRERMTAQSERLPVSELYRVVEKDLKTMEKSAANEQEGAMCTVFKF